MPTPTFYVPPPLVMSLPNDKILDSTNFDFEKSDIIRPPFEQAKNKEAGHTFTRVVIDSRDRNVEIYPNPNKYYVELETDIAEVTTGEVLIKDIPMPMYMINAFNNVFTVIVNDLETNVMIAQGNYANAASLLAALNAALRSFLSTGDVYFYATFDEIGSKFTFVNSGLTNFEIVCPAKSDMCYILGFAPLVKYASSSSGVLIAPFCINLKTDRYVVMRIEQFSINNSSNPVLHKSTALVGLADARGMRSLQPIKKWFNPPIARLLRIGVSFTDYYGNPYDFQNQDHRIEIMLESRKHLARYAAFV